MVLPRGHPRAVHPGWARVLTVLHSMKPARHLLMSATLALCVAAVLVARVVGQVGTTPIDAFLRSQLHASDSDLQALAQGRAVAKTLSSTSKREMTTAGGVRVRGTTITRFVDQYKTLEGFRTSQFVLQIAKFSPEPTLGDLGPLTLEPEDLEALEACRVGACDVQLSAGDIRRFNREVNWRSPTAARDATALYKAILLGPPHGVPDRRPRSPDRVPRQTGARTG